MKTRLERRFGLYCKHGAAPGYPGRQRVIAHLGALAMTERLLNRGIAEGKLHPDIDPLRLYVMIAALSQFHLTNVHTLSSMFDHDLSDRDWRTERRADARRMLASYLSKNAHR